MSKIREKQAQRRSVILEKVTELLKVKPFEEITIQAICQASGISVGSFYHYFKQKSDLLTGLMGLIDIYMIKRVFPLLTNQSALANLKAVSRGLASYIAESGIEVSKLISSSDPTDYNLSNEERPLYGKIEEIISAGQQSGEFKSGMSAGKVADLLLIAMSGVAVDWSRRNGSYSIRERMEEFTELFFPALLCTHAV